MKNDKNTLHSLECLISRTLKVEESEYIDIHYSGLASWIEEHKEEIIRILHASSN